MRLVLYSRELHEKYMQEIQKQIEDADRSSKQKAEAIVNTMADNYRNSILKRIEQEHDMELRARAAGNMAVADYHKMMVGIFKSILDSMGT